MKYTIAMPEDIIANLILALQKHPTLTLAFVFLVAFSESLVVVGLIVPGAIFMILFGALIAMNALEFWPTVFFATIGAIAGDSLSYWLGRRYKSKLHNIWPLSRHPEIIIRANQFFEQHGIKSIILSRFIGLLRPIIPAIAGMAKMPVKIFFAANVSSAVFWAPLYLLPGLLFGLSLEVASEFASKFILLLVFILLVIFIVLQSIQRLYVFTKPYNDKIINYLLSWGEKHTLLGEISSAVFNKEHHEVRGLSILAFLIFILTAVLVLLNSSFAYSYNPLYSNFDSLNQFIYLSLQAFRSPPLDNVMLWLSYLTSSYFFAILCLSLGVLFILKKNLFSLWYWLAAISLPLVLSPLLSNELARSLQQNLNLNFQPLPLIVVISVMGFLTIVINSGLSYYKQKIIFYFSSTLVLFLILAQLYFSFQVFTQAVFGLFISIIWFNVLGIAYRRHIKENIDKKTKNNILIIIVILLFYPGWKTFQHGKLYTPSENYLVMGTNSWLESGWEILPIIREGINQHKNDAFNLQWLGDKRNIVSKLHQLGFTNSLNSIHALSNWFLDDVDLNQLPVLPHIHKGSYETLRFYRYNKENQELTVIRLWPSKYRLRQDSPLQPLWFGNISFVNLKKQLGISYLVTKQEDINDLELDKTILAVYKRLILDNKENKNRMIFLVM